MNDLPQWLEFDPSKGFELCGRRLPGRLWTASGCFGYGLSGLDLRDAGHPEFDSPLTGIGMVVTKTLTVSPREGNPPPRIWDAGPGALNSIGLENVGLDAFLARVLPELKARDIPFIVSIAGTVPEEFGTMTARLAEAAADMPNWHGVELNLSCPNVAHGGVDFGRDPDTVTACTRAARKEIGDRLVLAKLTPNVASIARLATAAGEGGAHAITAINTLIGMDIDLRTGQPVLPRRRGGYSGPAILPVALAKVDEIVMETGLPVIGVGGIYSAGDVLKFFAVGAAAVQIGTAQLGDPFSVSRIAAGLKGNTD
jgi:dihydroorotate dehydrogenase (NAD+) catalytic subunit